ncbi:hypothetical protein KCU81_g856, partial [Aureobasidium melanogenum]
MHDPKSRDQSYMRVLATQMCDPKNRVQFWAWVSAARMVLLQDQDVLSQSVPDPTMRKVAARPPNIPTRVMIETEALTLRLSRDVQMTTAGSRTRCHLSAKHLFKESAKDVLTQTDVNNESWYEKAMLRVGRQNKLRRDVLLTRFGTANEAGQTGKPILHDVESTRPVFPRTAVYQLTLDDACHDLLVCVQLLLCVLVLQDRKEALRVGRQCLRRKV